MKKAKSVWTLAALVAGVGIGFGMAFSPATAQAGSSNLVECAYDYQCDPRCDGPGSGACYRGRCGCRW